MAEATAPHCIKQRKAINERIGDQPRLTCAVGEQLVNMLKRDKVLKTKECKSLLDQEIDGFDGLFAPLHITPAEPGPKETALQRRGRTGGHLKRFTTLEQNISKNTDAIIVMYEQLKGMEIQVNEDQKHVNDCVAIACYCV